MLEIIKEVFKKLENIEKYFIEELRKKDNIIKAQQKYIKQLEKFIDEV